MLHKLFEQINTAVASGMDNDTFKQVPTLRGAR